ncbi:hypothetical protein V8F20_012636 [Naviculisporaceae sp. PSN 640]
MASAEKATAQVLPRSARGNLEPYHPPHHDMPASRYIATQFTTLRARMTRAANPVCSLRSVSRIHWATLYRKNVSNGKAHSRAIMVW